LTVFAQALAVAAALPDGDFAEYGVTGSRLAALRERAMAWRAELLAG